MSYIINVYHEKKVNTWREVRLVNIKVNHQNSDFYIAYKWHKNNDYKGINYNVYILYVT